MTDLGYQVVLDEVEYLVTGLHLAADRGFGNRDFDCLYSGYRDFGYLDFDNLYFGYRGIDYRGFQEQTHGAHCDREGFFQNDRCVPAYH